jgi:hypothetical protein
MRCGGLSRPLIRRSRAQPISNSDRYEQHSPAGPNVWEPSRDNKASKGGLAALMEGRLLSVGCSTGNTARAVPLGPTLMASMSQWGSGGWPRSAQIQTDALPISAVPCRRLSSVCSFFMAIPLLNRRSGRREGKTTGVLCIASESRPVLGGTALTLETPRSEIAIVQRPSECDSTRLRIARAWGRCERPTILNLELGLE